MHLEICKLEYLGKLKERFLAEAKNCLKKLIQSRIYPKKVKILVDEPGKRLYITSNEEYEKDKNIITKIKKCYYGSVETLDEIFAKEKHLRLVNFLNIPPVQLSLKLLGYLKLIRRQLFFWSARSLFILKMGKYCLKKLGVGFNGLHTTIIARNASIDRMAPSIIFIDDYATVGARTILQSHGIKSNKGYGLCYTIGPIYIMEGADISSDCIVLPGTIVGKGCAVYPMAVVKRDVCPVYAGSKLCSVVYNQREEYPFRLNMPLAELKDLGLSAPIYFKNLKGKIIPAD